MYREGSSKPIIWMTVFGALPFKLFSNLLGCASSELINRGVGGPKPKLEEFIQIWTVLSPTVF
jgi:hypothetical protein